MEELLFENSERKRIEEYLREANNTKDKFFSIIAHDLKNPLQILLSSSYLLDKYFQNENYKKLGDHIQKVNKSVLGLNDLLENLLDLVTFPEREIFLSNLKA